MAFNNSIARQSRRMRKGTLGHDTIVREEIPFCERLMTMMMLMTVLVILR